MTSPQHYQCLKCGAAFFSHRIDPHCPECGSPMTEPVVQERRRPRPIPAGV